MRRAKIATIIGTRPEVIKLAPVISALNESQGLFEHTLIASGQHREMLDQALAFFNLRPDFELNFDRHDQRLANFAAQALGAFAEQFSRLRPDLVLVQGDTTTSMIASLAAFYQKSRIGHIEAGLRTFDRLSPFPEEINRRITSCIADFHFAPTGRAKENLLKEGVPECKVFVTGNTIVDSMASVRIEGGFDNEKLNSICSGTRRVIFVTAHRRENHGSRLRSICKALSLIVDAFVDVELVFPVHLNPDVRREVHQALASIERLHLTDPISYGDSLRMLERCHFVLTDSGGIQEEAPSFKKPVLILRDVTERPELIESGFGKLVGTTAERVYADAARLLNDETIYRSMIATRNPFGDGHAAERIKKVLIEQLCKK